MLKVITSVVHFCVQVWEETCHYRRDQDRVSEIVFLLYNF